MERTERLIVGIFVSLVVLHPSLLSQASAKLQIKIWTDKEEYLTREPISVLYEVKNISDSAICFTFDNVKEFFNIKDQLGRGYANTVQRLFL